LDDESRLSGEEIDMIEVRRKRGIVFVLAMGLGLLAVRAAAGGPDPKSDRLALYREMVGVYEAKVDGRPFFVTYYLENGRLRTVHADNAPADCVPVAGQELKFELAALSDPRPQLEFVRDETGRILKCLTRTRGRELVFIKRSGL
jgi:hypothetical protein